MFDSVYKSMLVSW